MFYDILLKPFYDDFIRPLGQDSIKPLIEQVQQEYVNPLITFKISPDSKTAFIRVLRIALTFFIYQVVTKQIGHYTGRVGIFASVCVLYSLGDQIDPPSNYLATASWLLVRGSLKFIKSWTANTEILVCLLMISHRQYLQKKLASESSPLHLGYSNAPSSDSVQ